MSELANPAGSNRPSSSGSPESPVSSVEANEAASAPDATANTAAPPGSQQPASAEASTPTQSPESAPAESTMDPYELREKIIQVLHNVYDPEIPVDIWELGLVYRLDVREDGDVYIQMTLTSPMCPVAGSLPPEVQQRVASVPGVRNVQVDLTWDPPWHMGMMSDVARLKLGFM